MWMWIARAAFVAAFLPGTAAAQDAYPLEPITRVPPYVADGGAGGIVGSRQVPQSIPAALASNMSTHVAPWSQILQTAGVTPQ